MTTGLPIINLHPHIRFIFLNTGEFINYSKLT